MALVSCKECNKKISDKAKKCPNCGYEKKVISWKLIVLILFIIFYGIGYIFDKDDTVQKTDDETRLERQTQDVKNCVRTFGQGVYRDKSLSWKLHNCNASD